MAIILKIKLAQWVLIDYSIIVNFFLLQAEAKLGQAQPKLRLRLKLEDFS